MCVYDQDKDGMSAYLNVTASEDDWYQLKASGLGHSNCADASLGGVYNLPENKTICFEIWAQDGNGPMVGYNKECWYNDH